MVQKWSNLKISKKTIFTEKVPASAVLGIERAEKNICGTSRAKMHG